MNLLTSYNWLKEHVDINLTPEEFAEEFSLRSMSVEEIIRLSEKYENVVIGQVKALKTHPDADKLQLAETDLGDQTVQIVCGGNNLSEGQKVVVALPGAKVKWHGEDAWTELKETKIRGEKSFGMICAPEELDLEKVKCPEGGIWDVTELLSEAAPGTDFAEAFFGNDVLFDMEVTTNRSDSMCITGLAREAGVVFDKSFKLDIPDLPTGSGKDLSVKLADNRCERYMAIVIDCVKVAPSPAWLQARLLSAGRRPINNVVDVTNYLLLEYGQPLHAFDYEKIAGQEIHIRPAKKGEKMTALDEEEYELNESHMVIADADGPIAIAGVMGGLESGTKDETTTIVLESAIFDGSSIRKTARGLNLFSDAQSMYEKGLSTESAPVLMKKAVQMILDLAGGQVASSVIDERQSDYKIPQFKLNTESVRKKIGVEIEDSEQLRILEQLGFTCIESGEGEFSVQVPYYRDHDIEHDIDLVEEIARMYGYANIPSKIPAGTIPLWPADPALTVEDDLKNTLAGSGYTEFYSMSLVSEKQLTDYNLDPEKAVRIHNELNAFETHLRTSLMPSLLTSVAKNEKHQDSAKVFELSRVYDWQGKDELPREHTMMTIAHFGDISARPSFREIKGLIMHLANRYGLEASFERAEDSDLWHPTQTANVLIGGAVVGTLGAPHDDIKDRFGIDVPVMVAEIDVEKTFYGHSVRRVFNAFSEAPSITRDISMLLSENTEFSDINDAVLKVPVAQNVELVDIYKGEHVPEGHQSVTIRVEFSFGSETPTSEQIEAELKLVTTELEKNLAAQIR